MTYHHLVEDIKSLLQKNNLWFETFEHEPVRTSEEAAKTRPGYSLEQGAKALILKTQPEYRNSQFVMLVIPANLKIDNPKVKKILSAKDVRFASESEIGNITNGVQIGGVPPFGNLFMIPVVVDPKMFDQEKIVFNAGDRRYSLAMKSHDYKKVVGPEVFQFTK